MKYIYQAKLQNAVGGKGSVIRFGKEIYDGTTVSTSYLVGSFLEDVTSTNYHEYSFEMTFNFTTNKIYIGNYAFCAKGYGNRVYFYSVVREMTYGDRTYLYL